MTINFVFVGVNGPFSYPSFDIITKNIDCLLSSTFQSNAYHDYHFLTQIFISESRVIEHSRYSGNQYKFILEIILRLQSSISITSKLVSVMGISQDSQINSEKYFLDLSITNNSG